MAEHNSLFPGDLDVRLDGLTIVIPPERRSFSAIRSYLELLALQQQRIVCSLNVDGQPMNLTQPRPAARSFTSIDAETMSLAEVPAQLIKAAMQQTAAARARVQIAIDLILINDAGRAQELWWGIATGLKEPLLTLSLLPNNICGPENGRASWLQIRRWQLQQLGCVVQDVDHACEANDPVVLSEALEKRVLPWLDNFHESLTLWEDTMAASTQSAAVTEADPSVR